MASKLKQKRDSVIEEARVPFIETSAQSPDLWLHFFSSARSLRSEKGFVILWRVQLLRTIETLMMSSEENVN